MDKREKIIFRTGLTGILTNLLLAALKAVVGLAANSMAMVSDAVNNASDMLSSIITIVGAKLASRAPDKKHPLGHGRIEYISASLVAALVLYAGITVLIESVKKILHPEAVDHTVWTIVLLAVAVGAKILLGKYTQKKGREVNSGALIASGADALQDAILSGSVLLSALLYLLLDVNIEAWIGLLIALFIIRAGIGMITDAVNDLVGIRADSELSTAVKQTMLEEDGVLGVYDLLFNDYGPNKNIAAAHIEVADDMTAIRIDALTRRLQEAVYQKNGVILATVGIYASNTANDEAIRIREDVQRRVMEHEGTLQVHGFFVDPEAKRMSLDIVLDFDVKDRQALYQHLVKDIQDAYPDYNIRVTLDLDLSD